MYPLLLYNQQQKIFFWGKKDSDSVIVTPHAILWQLTAEQHKIPQNNYSCLHKLKKRGWHSVWKQVTWSKTYIEGLKEERIPVECMLVHAGSESEECWIQEPVATSPSHQETLELLKGKAKTTHPWLHMFSHIRTTLTAWFLSLALAFATHKQHIQTHTCNNHISFELSRLVCTWL